MANPYLHCLLPLFELLYNRGARELWYYEDNGNFILRTHNMRGVRRGYVLGMFLFCLAMEPVYSRLRAAMGEQGTLYAYCDDSYLIAEPDKIDEILTQAPAIFDKVGLKIGYGPGKTDLALPRGYETQECPYPLADPEVPAPNVVLGFKACLGVLRHYYIDQAFIKNMLQDMGVKHDRLLDMVEEISDDDPFAALRLLQACGVSGFGHVLSVVPLSCVAHNIDEALAATLATIQ